MLKNIIIFLGIALVMTLNIALAQPQDEKSLAIKAAQSWLAEVDKEEYAKSYDDAAKYFKNAVTKQKWEQTIGAVRKPLGTVSSRKLKNATYTTTLPGAPDGKYVVIQFNTSFSNKKDSVETITPMFDDGKWKVSGYYIK